MYFRGKMLQLGCIVWLFCSGFYCSTASNGPEELFYLSLPVKLPRGQNHFAGVHQELNDNKAIHLSSNANSLYGVLKLDGHVVLDVLSGWGVSYLPLSQSVGKSGAIVAIEKDALYFSCLQENSANKDAWDRTLILHLDPCVGEQTQHGLHTISSVMKSIELNCPRLIRINDNEVVKRTDPFNALLGGVSLISRCRPYVLIDCRADDAASATAIAEFFSLFKNAQQYSLRWFDVEQTVTVNSVDGEVLSLKRVTPSLFAVPSNVQEDQSTTEWLQSLTPLNIQNGSTDDMTTWENVIKYLNQSRFNSTDYKVEQESAAPAPPQSLCVGDALGGMGVCPEPEHSVQDCGFILKEHTQITVFLNDIVQTESLMGALFGLAPSRDSDGENSTFSFETRHAVRASISGAQLDSLVIPYHYSSAVRVDNLRQVALVHCTWWMHTLSGHLPAAMQERLHALTYTCSAFVEKRLRTLRRILSVRAMTMQQPDLVLDQTGKQTNFPEALQYEALPVTSTPHLFYRMSENSSDTDAGDVRAIDPRATMESWFAHQPFEAVPDEAICGEPIWCSHTLEFQRRIHVWQNPDLPRVASPDLLGQSVKDWTQPSSKQTCATSKFLVYEPVSNKHGIGALMQLIASTFRFAVCLDRILVLNFVDQAPTLLKWRHPGCQGSMLECYFQPISGCTLSEEDIATAPTTLGGAEFERFPLREERVLRLEGMPTEGPCALCHSAWPVDSRFFDGLFVGGTYDAKSGKMHVKHATAFQTSIKATWTSQFIRYLMRPRPWLQDAVAQIVLYSMQSPAPALPVDKSYLDNSDFPREFISLHVRFGMKLAEATLEPLTRYMDFIARKLPHFRDIFISTETEAVIATLRTEYPEYRFHALRYPRKEFLDLGLLYPHLDYHRGTDYVDEMLFSLANLYVASEAQAFVGTLSSNWCMMIMQLERTRGDGGNEYFSMDAGSAYTSCF